MEGGDYEMRVTKRRRKWRREVWGRGCKGGGGRCPYIILKVEQNDRRGSLPSGGGDGGTLSGGGGSDGVVDGGGR